MKKIVDYLKFAAVLIAVLTGVQVPAFIDQYGKNLDARLAESSRSVGEFQDDADKYFNGDINQLIEHYESKGDPVIIAGGESLGAMVSRNKLLDMAKQEFTKSAFSAYRHVFTHAVPEIRSGTWLNFTYSVVLNRAAITSAVIFAVATLMLFELVVLILGSLFGTLNRSTLPTAKS